MVKKYFISYFRKLPGFFLEMKFENNSVPVTGLHITYQVYELIFRLFFGILFMDFSSKRECSHQVTVASLKSKTLIMYYDKKRMKPTSRSVAIVDNAFTGHCLLQKRHGLFSMSVMQPFLIS